MSKKKKSVPQKNLLVLGIKIKYSDYITFFAPEQLPFGSLHIMVSTHKTSHFIPRQQSEQYKHVYWHEINKN